MKQHISFDLGDGRTLQGTLMSLDAPLISVVPLAALPITTAPASGATSADPNDIYRLILMGLMGMTPDPSNTDAELKERLANFVSQYGDAKASDGGSPLADYLGAQHEDRTGSIYRDMLLVLLQLSPDATDAELKQSLASLLNSLEHDAIPDDHAGPFFQYLEGMYKPKLAAFSAADLEAACSGASASPDVRAFFERMRLSEGQIQAAMAPDPFLALSAAERSVCERLGLSADAWRGTSIPQ